MAKAPAKTIPKVAGSGVARGVKAIPDMFIPLGPTGEEVAMLVFNVYKPFVPSPVPTYRVPLAGLNDMPATFPVPEMFTLTVEGSPLWPY